MTHLMARCGPCLSGGPQRATEGRVCLPARGVALRLRYSSTAARSAPGGQASKHGQMSHDHCSLVLAWPPS